MAVVLWGAVGVVVTALLSEEHSEHSDYDNYGNYSNYSDYAERQRKRLLESRQSDTESAAQELSAYKRSDVNPELSSQYLKEQSAMRVSGSEMDSNASAKINRRIKNDEESETSSLKSELELIDDVLGKISRIERENS